jgi:hypothetical protein
VDSAVLVRRDIHWLMEASVKVASKLFDIRVNRLPYCRCNYC